MAGAVGGRAGAAVGILGVDGAGESATGDGAATTCCGGCGAAGAGAAAGIGATAVGLSTEKSMVLVHITTINIKRFISFLLFYF